MNKENMPYTKERLSIDDEINIKAFNAGPYHVKPWIDNYRSSHKYAIYNGSDKPVWTGTRKECRTMCAEWNLGYAMWLMIRGTKAEGL